MKQKLLLTLAIIAASIFQSNAQVQIDKRIELTNSGSNAKVEGVDEVINNHDAANKIYVDTSIANALNPAATFDFTLTAGQPSVSVFKNSTSPAVSLSLTYASGTVNGFVSLSASGLPSGATLIFTGAAAGFPSFTSAFTVTCNGSVVAGTYPITITATGGITPKTTVVNLVILPVLREFITSSNFGAAMGGTAGGDAICQSLANSAGLGGTWKAWLSDSGNNAKDRVTHGAIISAVSGALIASDWTDFLDGSNFGLNYDEYGTQRTGWPVWTGTNNDGTKSSSTCLDWNTSSGSYYGLRGNTYGGNLWSSDGGATINCNYSWPFYCLEQ